MRCLYLYPLLILSLAGCGPQYVVKEDFYPPDSPAGLKCVSHCQSLKSQCKRDCQNGYIQCRDSAWRDARLTLPTALQIYDIEMQHYDRHVRQYNRSLKTYAKLRKALLRDKNSAEQRCKKRNQPRCDAATKIDKELESLRKDYYFGAGPLAKKPSKPHKPDLHSEARMLEAQRCVQGCDCETDFKLCYQQCGGHIDSRKICVRNCKENK